MQWSSYLKAVVALMAILLSLTLAQADQVQNSTGSELEFSKVLAQASADDANAQNLVGAMYQTGSGVARSDEEAARWYSKAADHGHPAAQAILGAMYMVGQGVPRDDARGVNLLILSAAQQLPLGIARLGAAYMQGWGVKQDAEKGTRLLLQAVDLGVGLAAFEIGMAHRWGRGATKDEGEARKWFQKSAELGYPDGQYISAKFYETDGGRRLALYLKAANGGHAGAQYQLGRIYHRTPELYDRDKAIHWYSLAALNGNQMGNQGLFKLGLPDVNGNQPINSKVMTSSASTEKLDGHTTPSRHLWLPLLSLFC